eukprot:gene10771-1001_t
MPDRCAPPVQGCRAAGVYGGVRLGSSPPVSTTGLIRIRLGHLPHTPARQAHTDSFCWFPHAGSAAIAAWIESECARTHWPTTALTPPTADPSPAPPVGQLPCLYQPVEMQHYTLADMHTVFIATRRSVEEYNWSLSTCMPFEPNCTPQRCDRGEFYIPHASYTQVLVEHGIQTTTVENPITGYWEGHK